MSFKDLKVGDKVQRMLGGDKPFQLMTVMDVGEKNMVCAAPGTEGWALDQLWTFDRESGVEEDHELGWGVKFGRTGTYLKKVGS